MKFDDLDKQMRVYETAVDYCVLPGIFIVARLDGRNFTTLTKDKARFEAPFDVRFRDLMTETTAHLMNCGFKVVYGYTESDEISLLFDIGMDLFGRKIRKFNSVLAGEASAKFSLLFGDIGVFDCRICQLPNEKIVADYFRWRNEDAHRNALNAHCYWMLRKENYGIQEATAYIDHKTVAEKNELLFSRGVNFNDLPNWQKRGVGIYWTEEEKSGYNPKEKIAVKTERKVIKIDYKLPMGDEYGNFYNADGAWIIKSFPITLAPRVNSARDEVPRQSARYLSVPPQCNFRGATDSAARNDRPRPALNTLLRPVPRQAGCRQHQEGRGCTGERDCYKGLQPVPAL
jgi:tRNA(His) 5'-end guanylyltransferase